jgi:Fur family iron response transcriptional regulator
MKDLVQLLTSHNISPTHQRVQIAQVLFTKPQHLSAEQILKIVNHEHTVASKATVYNTLGLFAKKGLVREVIIDPNKVFYDSNTSAHHHFYNVDTGELFDIDACELDINNLPQPPQGTAREGVDIIIRISNTTQN